MNILYCFAFFYYLHIVNFIALTMLLSAGLLFFNHLLPQIETKPAELLIVKALCVVASCIAIAGTAFSLLLLQ